MTIEPIVYVGIGMGAGAAGLATYFWIYTIHKKTQAVVKILRNFPTPEEMAKEILKVKLPMSEVPEEAMENISELVEEEKAKKNNKKKKAFLDKKTKSNYIG